jgi:hypothetical protein
MVDFHLAGGGRGAPAALGTIDAKLSPRALLAADEDDLLSLFDALNGSLPLPPWNDWPDR